MLRIQSGLRRTFDEQAQRRTYFQKMS